MERMDLGAASSVKRSVAGRRAGVSNRRALWPGYCQLGQAFDLSRLRRGCVRHLSIDHEPATASSDLKSSVAVDSVMVMIGEASMAAPGWDIGAKARRSSHARTHTGAGLRS